MNFKISLLFFKIYIKYLKFFFFSLGIIFNEEGCYSIRGKFANTKLSGVGRVELENGEIFDGLFRNGVFMKGTYFNSFGDYFVSGIF
jgi:hypothetical protein